MDMRFGTWNIRFFYRAGSLIADATGIKMDLRERGIGWYGLDCSGSG
jgi:hypothetical protein